MTIIFSKPKQLTQQEAVDAILVLNNLLNTLGSLGDIKLVPKIEKTIDKLLDLI